jgi:uncharacterized LabA/DUF88 family protein
MNQRKVVFFIDGWFMRKRVYNLKSFYYSGENIRNYCKKHLRPDDYLYRIFYYDTEPLEKKGHNPITKKGVDFGKTPVALEQKALFDSIKRTPNMALRLGKTEWRNNTWILAPDKLKELLNKKTTIDQLSEEDVRPLIEQKAVDMKIGLDIALIATKRLADLLIIITGDADMVPALKLARREGMQVGLGPLRQNTKPELSEHVDFVASHIIPK